MIKAKTIFAFASLASCCLLLTSCGAPDTNSIPASLRAGASVSPLSVSPFQIESVFSGMDDEPVVAPQEQTFPYEVPDGYQNLSGNLFAIVENGEITGYRVSVQQEDGTWVWKESDAAGNIVEEEEETTTRPSSSSGSRPSSSSSSSSSSNNSSSGSGNSSSSDSTPASPPVTEAPPTEAAFQWRVISQSSCPVSVSNTFDQYILRSSAATSYVTNGGSTYALVKAPAGQGVTIHSVSENGVLSYSYTSSGNNYQIVVVNRSLGINFSKR